MVSAAGSFSFSYFLICFKTVDILQVDSFFDAFMMYYKDEDRWDKIVAYVGTEKTRTKLRDGFYSYVRHFSTRFSEEQVSL